MSTIDSFASQATSSRSSQGSQTRRFPMIASMTSTQKVCCICGDTNNRRRIPKEALSQAWLEKNILIPHQNRVCSHHLIGKLFTHDDLHDLKSNKQGVLMTDEELGTWILQLTHNSRPNMRPRLDFDDPTNTLLDDYHTLIGFSKFVFDDLLTYLKGHINSSTNRTPRNAPVSSTHLTMPT